MPHNKVVVLLDLANFSCGFDIIRKSKNMNPNVKMDFAKLISHITLGSEIVAKYVYVGTHKDGNEKGQQNFLHYFKKNGFKVVTKECKIITQEDKTTKRKANFDVEITTDCCTHMWRRECTEIILVSGDSDFAYLLEKAIEFNFQISVVSTERTLSRELRELAQKTGKLILLDKLDLEYLSFNSIK